MPDTRQQRQRRTLVLIAIAVLLLGLLGSCGLWLTRDDAKPQPGALTIVPREQAPPQTGDASDGGTVDAAPPVAPSPEPTTTPAPAGGSTGGSSSGSTNGSSQDAGVGGEQGPRAATGAAASSSPTRAPKPKSTNGSQANGGGHVSGEGSSEGNGEGKGHAPFAAVGHIDQLRPGAISTLEVVVTNPDRVAYRILDLSVKAADASPGCRASTNLVLGSYRSTKPGARTYVVPAKGRITVPLSVMMLDTAASQDACKSVTFPLTFSGSATQGNNAS
jgi:hypothetical protein